MQRHISVDVVGCGEISQIMHLPHLFELADRFTVRAICDRDPHVLKGVAERHNVGTTYTDHREMFAESTADAVVILSSGDHAKIITEALDNGMDVFVEKPLCYSTQDALEIVNRTKATGKTVMVGYSRLFDSAFTDLRNGLAPESGPVYIRAEASLPWDYYYIAHHDVVRPIDWTPPMTSARWGGSWDYFYYEVLFNLAIHEVYCLRELTGIGTPEVRASSDILDRRGVEASWSDRTNFHVSMGVLTLDTIAGGYVEEFRAVTGSETYVLSYPSIYLKNRPATLTRTRLQNETLVCSESTGSYVEPFKAELEHFHEVLSGQRSCVSSAEHAAADVATLNQIFEATKEQWEQA